MSQYRGVFIATCTEILEILRGGVAWGGASVGLKQGANVPFFRQARVGPERCGASIPSPATVPRRVHSPMCIANTMTRL